MFEYMAIAADYVVGCVVGCVMAFIYGCIVEVDVLLLLLFQWFL